MAEPPTWRVRRIPAGVRGEGLAEFLCEVIRDAELNRIRIYSLAPSPEDHNRPPSQTATVQFLQSLPQCLEGREQCPISIPGQRHAMIIDRHFLGFTSLNQVDSGLHSFDLIALSGLAGHAFGSWKKPHDAISPNQRTFMWLRDQLPHDFPNIRVMTYGYDAKLRESKSFQNIDDIALAFLAELKTIGKINASSKPTILFAHSLGGLIIKQALCYLAASGESQASFILETIRLVIFFGVPSQGMKVDYMLKMAEGQPNETLLKLLSEDITDGYLSQLSKTFSGISIFRHLRQISAYETVETREAKEVSPGKWKRIGPFVRLVARDSAIQEGSRGNEDIFAINRNHSEMVKFAEDDAPYLAVKGFVRSIVDATESANPMASLGDYKRNSALKVEPSNIEESDIQKALKSLHFDEKDYRLENISNKHSASFEWLLHPETGFTRWLHTDSALFWIQGKAGGKSTLKAYMEPLFRL